MKLYYVPASPYARKVLIAAAERGLDGRLERIIASPWTDLDKVAAVNPAGRVPVLVSDDGMVLYDSPVICEYLDSIGSAPKLFPDAGAARWQALRRQALGDALLDAMIARRLESRRPDGERSQAWMARQVSAVGRCLDAMEEDTAGLDGEPAIGHIAYLCALGHLDFRFADEDWRVGRSRLASWYEGFSARPAARTYVPHD